VNYKISLTQAALNDLYAINEYYLAQVSDKVAANILNDIQETIQNLEHCPERGSVPSELTVTGINRYRQVFSSVYRIVYRIKHDEVYVVMVIDGRRDVASALIRRQLIQ
jgi:toxin ParE1/3/4